MLEEEKKMEMDIQYQEYVQELYQSLLDMGMTEENAETYLEDYLN